MSFIAKTIGPDERLICIARLHWIYIVQGIIWFSALSLIGGIADHYLRLYSGNTIPFYTWTLDGLSITTKNTGVTWLFFGGGVYILCMHLIKVWATEVALTSRRVVYKTGLIFVEVEEIELEEIKGEHIHHGFLGRFLRYGTLHFDCRFIGDVYLPAVKKPYRFIKAMHVAKSKLADSMSFQSPVPKERQDDNHPVHHKAA